MAATAVSDDAATAATGDVCSYSWPLVAGCCLPAGPSSCCCLLKHVHLPAHAGARPDEAVSWGKIRADAKPVKVGSQPGRQLLSASADQRLPLLLSAVAWRAP